LVLTLENRHGDVWMMQACAACHKEALVGVIECKACESKTHIKCVSPSMSTVRFQWFSLCLLARVPSTNGSMVATS